MWAMNNKWQVMYKVMESPVYIKEKSARMTIAKKKDTGFEKWSEIKVTHKNASFRPRIGSLYSIPTRCVSPTSI